MNEEAKRPCPICHHGMQKPGTTTSTFVRESTTLVVKNVPAAVCDSCGEAYVTDEITGQLLDQAEQAYKEGVEVDVRQYSEHALKPSESE